MAGILDLLKKAAGTGTPDPSTPSTPASSAGIDVGKMAQDAADDAKAKSFTGAPYPKTPLSSTMTPQKSNGKNK